MSEQRRIDRWTVLCMTVLGACNFNASSFGSAGDDGGGSTATTATTESSASSGAQGGTSGSGAQDGTSGSGGAVGCGNASVEPEEECDDANADETDGCLSTCVVPRSCAHVLAELPGIADGQYRIELPTGPLDVYCDMVTDGGGWALVAKVNPTNQDTAPRSEPVGWLDMELGAEHLASPDLVLNGPLASHGASRLLPLVDEGTLARFELIAADDYGVTVAWYKQVLAAGLASWFDFGDLPTMVCSDLAMSIDCGMGSIAPTGGSNSTTPLQGMDTQDFGYPGGYPIHMRLDDDGSQSGFSALCSSTEDRDGNAWPDSYDLHWGNALRIWLR
jgi:cysteine-rich repeat protein